MAPLEGGRPSILTKRGTDALLRIERLMDDAARVLATTSGEPSKTTDAQGCRGAAAGGFGCGGRSTEPAEGEPGQLILPRTSCLDDIIGAIVRLLFGAMFALAVAAAIGLGTTWVALTRGTAYGGMTIGAWTAWPKNGTAGIDPYARAHGCAHAANCRSAQVTASPSMPGLTMRATASMAVATC